MGPFLMVLACVLIIIAFFGIVIADGIRAGEYRRRQARPPLPRRAATLAPEDARTLAWARGLKLNWEQKEISARIAALDVRPAEIPPTETPGPQLEYRDTTTSWADLRKLAAILDAEDSP